MSLNIRHLKYFVATAESGQVSRAAAALSISQSAVTAAIKELELTTGADLFTRSSGGMELTESGRRFLSSAYDILSKVDEALRLSEADEELTGSLSLAATYTVIGYFLPVHLDRLHRYYPGLRIEIHELTRENIEEGLLSNRFDLAMLLTSNTNNPEIATETLLSSPRRLWLSGAHPLLEQDSVGFEEISQEPYVMLTVDEAAFTTQKYWGPTPFRPNVRLRTSSIEAVRSIVANGQGVSILSDMVYRPWSLEGKRIETRVPSKPIPPMDVGLAWRAGATFTPEMEAVRMYFRSTFLTPMGQGSRYPHLL
ncbi:UNVERIFIED_CONTAM: hypothetical protein GTU68_037805 [Idotea baltica]|nr:hypothetical protein [Idotea baltica]